MNKAAGRPWPVLCPEDDVMDFMICEAVAIKAHKEDEKAQERQRRDDFKKNVEGLEQFR